MIVVDSSVWIDFFNGRDAPHVRQLRVVLGMEEIIVGDLMLCEVLQDLGSEREAHEVETLLRRFAIMPMAGESDRYCGGPQFSHAAPARDYHPQNHRPRDRDVVYHKPHAPAP